VSITVNDPFGAAPDRAIPSLAMALDPAEAHEQFSRCLTRLAAEHGFIRLRAIRVSRYKPGRRCMIEYDVEVERPDLPPEPVTLLGKVRAGRYGKSGYRLLSALWEAGFQADCPDGMSVPEPIGTVGRFRMWLQRKVPGPVATEVLTGAEGPALARRVAEAAHKLHRAGVPTERRHTMADELRILHEYVPTVALTEPRWAGRIERLLDGCDRLGAATPQPNPCGIHRDLYSDQVIVDGSRLYIVDFDLYCEGDPGVDIGNFLGHVTELSLRTLGDPDGLAHVEQAIEERFIELSGEATRPSVKAYAILTLVRHIYLSSRFPERRSFTGRLLELCEERLGRRGPRPGMTNAPYVFATDGRLGGSCV
jgi:aminoglycoside phosphotransferase (APT) family kinase protein